MLVEYNGYLIEGKAAMIHPYDPNHYPAGVILRHGRASSMIKAGLL